MESDIIRETGNGVILSSSQLMEWKNPFNYFFLFYAHRLHAIYILFLLSLAILGFERVQNQVKFTTSSLIFSRKKDEC